MIIDLPPVDVGVPLTLVVLFTDGKEMRVPYIDRPGAVNYLSMNSGTIDSYYTESYKGI